MKHVIILPDLGQTTSEAKVLQWHKSIGEKVGRGEPILEVETDKVDMDVESFAEGYLREMLVQEGDTATALEPVAILTDTPDEDYPQDEAAESSVAAPAVEAPKRAIAEPGPKAPSKAGAAPAARRLASELDVDLSQVTGTGPNGLITRKDVEAYTEGRRSSGTASARVPRALAAMAATTVESKRQIPHFYVTRELDCERVSEWRADWNQAHPEAKTTFNDLFVWAAAKALRDVPRLNLVWRNGSYEQRESEDILLVVADGDGLFLAPLAHPCELSWPDYIRRMRKAVEGASTGSAVGAGESLRPALAVSNLGMHQVESFAAIIPLGCAAVLAIGSVAAAPIVERGEVVVRRRCKVTLSADHRVVDGVSAARFLERMQRHLETHGSEEIR